jgi:RND family efflux transporter MFP subunit
MKKKILLFVVILIGFAVLAKIAVTAKEEDGSEETAKIVKLSEVGTKEIQEEREFSGIVKGMGEVEIAPEISGRLVSVNKKEGEKVAKGEILATIDATDFLAQNSLSAEQTQVSKDAFSATEEYQGQLVDEARIELEKAEDLKKEAKKDGDESGLKIAKRNVEKAEEAIRTAKRMRDLQLSLSQGEVDLSQKQARITSLGVNKTIIRAPFSGIFTKKLSQEGQIVSPETAIMVLVQSEQKEIAIDLPSEVANKLKLNQEVFAIKEKIKDNRENEEGEKFAIIIASISPVSDEITRKSSVKFSFDNPDVALGEFVRVLIPVNKKQDALAVPITSLKKSYFEDVIFVVENEIAKEQKVKLGIIDGDSIEIINGLTEGQSFVVEGQQNLRNGDKIRIHE